MQNVLEQTDITSAPELCLVIPTFNERDNIVPLIERIEAALKGTRYEIMFVDDNSPDGTADQVRSAGLKDSRIRVIRRVKRRGLSSAVVEGCLATNAPYIAVMDCDLQHDERILPVMFEALNSGSYDLVIGSRRVEGGRLGGMSTLRQRISRWSSDFARWVLKSDVQDLMSGFFMMRREIIDETAPKLTQIGFKILADILATSPRHLRIKEIPIQFRPRLAGQSKLDKQVAVEFVLLLLDKTIGRWIPTRLVAFMAVGSIGVIVHFAILTLLHRELNVGFDASQILAALTAITANYSVNNAFTYGDLRLRGARWILGWLSFSLISAIGAVGNVGVAHVLFNANIDWGLSALAGVVVGTVWNFAMTRIYVWGDR
jgi:dolichol-phosphate mannosyltransferase